MIIENTLFVGKVLHHLPLVDSTNDFAKRLIANSKPIHGTVVLSYQQTAGRGQFGRKWETQKEEAIAFSLILTKPGQFQQAFYLNKAIALAVQRTLQNSFPSQEPTCRIKWPNDLIIRDKKVAGILIENNYRGTEFQANVVGIGVNLNQNAFPAHLPQATSLWLEDGQQRNLDTWVQNLCFQLEKQLIRYYQFDYAAIDADYHKALYALDTTATLQLANGTRVKEKILGVNPEGLLISLGPQGKNCRSHAEASLLLA
jgi:BirA family transcriptional regulator, biotin operon repressor / biotin---[acetyl-CoA-carboxylase] ligase